MSVIFNHIAAPLIAIISVPVLIILLWKSKVLVSPYRKANHIKRILAALIDVFICAILYLAAITLNRISLYIFTCMYILFRDKIFNGRSFGKIFFNMAAIRLKDSKFCSLKDSLMRNFIFVIPVFNILAFMVEISLIILHDKGIRLGDRLAKTQVVEGMDVPEYSEVFQRRLFNDLFPEKIQDDEDY